MVVETVAILLGTLAPTTTTGTAPGHRGGYRHPLVWRVIITEILHPETLLV